jgi:hypothetical protein
MRKVFSVVRFSYGVKPEELPFDELVEKYTDAIYDKQLQAQLIAVEVLKRLSHE